MSSGVAALFDFARKDIDLPQSSPTELLLDKHADYINKYEQMKEEYVSEPKQRPMCCCH